MEVCGPLCIMYIYTMQHYIHTLQHYNAALHTYIYCGGKSVVMRNAECLWQHQPTPFESTPQVALVAFEDCHCFFSRFFSHSPTPFYTLDKEYHFHTH